MNDLPTTARQILGNITMGKIVPNIQPFPDNGAGQLGNYAANIPGAAVNTILGQGITAPVSDITKLALNAVQNKSPNYNDMNSGAVRLGFNTMGIRNTPQEQMNNLWTGVSPILAASILQGKGLGAPAEDAVATNPVTYARDGLGRFTAKGIQFINDSWKKGLK